MSFPNNFEDCHDLCCSTTPAQDRRLRRSVTFPQTRNLPSQDDNALLPGSPPGVCRGRPDADTTSSNTKSVITPHKKCYTMPRRAPTLVGDDQWAPVLLQSLFRPPNLAGDSSDSDNDDAAGPNHVWSSEKSVSTTQAWGDESANQKPHYGSEALASTQASSSEGGAPTDDRAERRASFISVCKLTLLSLMPKWRGR
mmetsp:Transcript_65311/g.144460  ORF Transcript_65311/g.144460 Transcript_65311/m.144460 type:complete len:197 (-) Transcript_65311:59-649(-)